MIFVFSEGENCIDFFVLFCFLSVVFNSTLHLVYYKTHYIWEISC